MADTVVYFSSAGKSPVPIRAVDNGDGTFSFATGAVGGINTTSRLPTSLATTNPNLVSAGPHRLYAIQGQNTKAGILYLKLYDKATAPVPGTDTPVRTLALAASAPFNFVFEGGIPFTTGLGFGITGAAADADTTNIAAGDVVGLNIDYR